MRLRRLCLLASTVAVCVYFHSLWHAYKTVHALHTSGSSSIGQREAPLPIDDTGFKDCGDLLDFWPLPRHCRVVAHADSESAALGQFDFHFHAAVDAASAVGAMQRGAEAMPWPEDDSERCDKSVTEVHVYLLPGTETLQDFHMRGAEEAGLVKDGHRLTITPHGNGIDIAVVAFSHSGVMNALATLAVLVAQCSNSTTNCRCIRYQRLQLIDWPRFSYRGFLLDTAHHFVAVPFLLRTLRFMALVKLNIFHWHITDHQSFGFHIPSHPTLATARNPYLRDHEPNPRAYSASDVDRVLRYASDLGIQVVPEIDVPSHTAGWAGAYPELVSTRCHDKEYTKQHEHNIAGKRCMSGNLNPSWNRTMDIVEDILRDTTSLFMPNDGTGISACELNRFPQRFLHLGGDEVDYKAWDTTAMRDWLDGKVDGKGGAMHQPVEEVVRAAEQNRGEWCVGCPERFGDVPHRVLEVFERKMRKIVDRVWLGQPQRRQQSKSKALRQADVAPALQEERVVVRWEEAFKPNLAACCLPPKNTVIEFWVDGHARLSSSMHDAARMGYRIIVASASNWYFDPPFYKSFSARYEFDPLMVRPHRSVKSGRAYRLPSALHAKVLGGEGACWGACISSEYNIESMSWGPLLAVSERLWSDEEKTKHASKARRRLGGVITLLAGAFGYKNIKV